MGAAEIVHWGCACRPLAGPTALRPRGGDESGDSGHAAGARAEEGEGLGGTHARSHRGARAGGLRSLARSGFLGPVTLALGLGTGCRGAQTSQLRNRRTPTPSPGAVLAGALGAGLEVDPRPLCREVRLGRRTWGRPAASTAAGVTEKSARTSWLTKRLALLGVGPRAMPLPRPQAAPSSRAHV